MFQRIGKAAYKKDLTNTLNFLEKLGNPHRHLKSIHIAGTNGKGSSAHALAAILQKAGYKTGLYTSPHLKNFTERIRIDGKEISEEQVLKFVQLNQHIIEDIEPSFFETTVAMAFEHFHLEKVDIAVVETGLGGRLDSTNVLTPELSLITNIGYDHMDMLGETLEEIASEKAGIIKENIPVVIARDQKEINRIFMTKAESLSAPLHNDSSLYRLTENSTSGFYRSFDINYRNNLIISELKTDIVSDYFRDNIPGVLSSVRVLNETGWSVSQDAIKKGFSDIRSSTGLKGRFQLISERPTLIADISHNLEGLTRLLSQIERMSKRKLRIIFGMVRDKGIHEIVSLLPTDAVYYLTQSHVPRALPVSELEEYFSRYGLQSSSFADVNEAINHAKTEADETDVILVTGSTFVVAEIDGL